MGWFVNLLRLEEYANTVGTAIDSVVGGAEVAVENGIPQFFEDNVNVDTKGTEVNEDGGKRWPRQAWHPLRPKRSNSG